MAYTDSIKTAPSTAPSAAATERRFAGASPGAQAVRSAADTLGMMHALVLRVRERSFDLWLNLLLSGAIGVAFLALSVFALSELITAVLRPVSDGP